MLRVGNDIVDLRLPPAKRKSKDIRFLKRTFLPEEEQYILADIQPDAMLWAFWSGKEAAYKAIQKDCPDVPSIPRYYNITIEREKQEAGKSPVHQGERILFGTVETPQGNIPLEIRITSQFVHCIAASAPPIEGSGIVWQVRRMPRTTRLSAIYESLFVREAVTKHIYRHHQSSTRAIEIRRHKGPRGLGPPILYIQDEVAAIDVSLSHDGRFAAYVFTTLP